MLISFFVSAFGIAFIYRILVYFRIYKFISDKLKQKLSVILLFIEIICLFLFKSGQFLIWCEQVLLIFLIYLIPIYAEFHRRKQFNKNVIVNIDLILIQMLSGRSFRESLKEFLARKDQNDYIFQEICSQISSNQSRKMITTSNLAIRIYSEFIKIDNSTHKRIEKLKSLRQILKIEEKFRQKSRTAQLQARAQSVILSIFYVIAMFYFFVNADVKANLRTFVLSVCLFIAGTVWVWKLGRKLTWKA
jgi:hypothetical protein